MTIETRLIQLALRAQVEGPSGIDALLDLATQFVSLLREAEAFEMHHDWYCKMTMGVNVGPCDCGLSDHMTRRRAMLDGEGGGDDHE